MTTYNYKVWFKQPTGLYTYTMNVSRSEPMSEADLIDFCLLDNKTYLSYVELPIRQDVSVTINFGSVCPITDINTALYDIIGFDSPLFDALKEALNDKISELELEDHINRTCTCLKVRMKTPQMVRVVRNCSRLSDIEIERLLNHINGICWNHSEILISNYLQEQFSHIYNEEEIEAKTSELEEIINT